MLVYEVSVGRQLLRHETVGVQVLAPMEYQTVTWLWVVQRENWRTPECSLGRDAAYDKETCRGQRQ